MNNPSFLSWREVTLRLGVSKMSIWRWVRDGKFPAPVRLGPNRVAFREADLDKWAAERESVEYGAGTRR